MLSAYTRAMGRFMNVGWYDLNGTPERDGGIPKLIIITSLFWPMVIATPHFPTAPVDFGDIMDMYLSARPI